MKISHLIVAGLAVFTAACGQRPQSSADVQRDRQETIVSEGVAQVGLPNIVNFRDARGVKFYYERRDQTGLLTYTYTKNMQGQWVWFCDSIGFPISGGTQFSAPESMQRWNLRATGDYARQYGQERLPQPEPNGIYPPSNAEGSGVICINPNTNAADATYSEERLTTFMWPRPNAVDEPNRDQTRPRPRDPLAPPPGSPAPPVGNSAPAR